MSRELDRAKVLADALRARGFVPLRSRTKLVEEAGIRPMWSVAHAAILSRMEHPPEEFYAVPCLLFFRWLAFGTDLLRQAPAHGLSRVWWAPEWVARIAHAFFPSHGELSGAWERDDLKLLAVEFMAARYDTEVQQAIVASYLIGGPAAVVALVGGWK